MRVWLTVMGQRLDDADNTRSMLLASALLRRGHDVVMWTSAFDHIRKEWRTEWRSGGEAVTRADRLEIRFMRGIGYHRNISARRFADHWLAARDFLRQASHLPRPDIIVASIPDHLTADAAARFARRNCIPFIVDVRDKWPDIFIDNLRHPAAALLARTILAYERHRARRTLRNAKAVLGMMRSMRDWGLLRAGRAQRADDRVFYLTTSPKNFALDPERPVSPSPRMSDALAKSAGKIKFAFVGTFNRTQHPLLILDALQILAERGVDLTTAAFLIGGGGIESEQLAKRARAFSCVHLLGWLNSEEMAALLQQVDVGLLPMNFPSPAFNNKAFSYIASGLPIINGATGDLAELIAEENVGINVLGGSAADFAEAISKVLAAPAETSAMASRMKVVFERDFDRDRNYAAYAEHLETIADKA